MLVSLITLVSLISTFESVTSPLYLKPNFQIRPDFLTIFHYSFAILIENTNAEMYRTFCPFFRNIGELVPWKQLVEARQTALHASIPWLASCSPCLSVFSTLPTGTHTFMPKNPLTGTIICSKVSLFFFFHFSAMYSS